jgi:TolA-binding protein
MRKSLLALPVLALLLVPPPAHAVAKEIIQLQTQVQQLSDMLQHLQETNDEHIGVLQHLVEQSADSVSKMAQQMTALQAQMEQNNKNDTLAAQIQGLNDSVDELKTRLGQVNKQLGDIQSQLQNVQAQPAPQAPQQGVAGGDPNNASYAPSGMPSQAGSGPQYAPGSGQLSGSTYGAPAAQVAPVDQLYQAALRDYNGARYDLATAEFADVLKYYPQNTLAGNSSYYLGEISYRQGLYPAAIHYYDMVLEQFAGSTKSAAAQLRKGQAELANHDRDTGIRDLRALVQRYPTSPEGAQGRSILNGMGVRIVPNKPNPGR